MNPANPKLIGGFVLGALGLLATALLVFGSGAVFRDYQQAVIFFQGSVGGLREGAPVDFRGVQIGTVKAISIQFDPRTEQFLIPVLVDLDPGRVREAGNGEKRAPYSLDDLIKRGLRAELRAQSFVTGTMAVQLNFQPGSDARTVATSLPYPQIPSVPSTFEQAQEILSQIGRRAPETLEKLNRVLDRAADLLGTASGSGDDVRQIVADLARFTRALADSDDQIRTIVRSTANVTTSLDRLTGHVDGAVTAFGETAQRLNKLVADNDPALRSAMQQLNRAGAGLTKLTDSLTALLQENREGLKDFSSTGLYDLMNLIRDAQDMVGNLNRGIEELRRNPSQFLFGPKEREVPAARSRTP